MFVNIPKLCDFLKGLIMQRQRVKVIAKECGVWAKGAIFKTTMSHARELKAQNLVQFVGSPSQRRQAREAEEPETQSDKPSAEKIEEEIVASLEWPAWLNDSQLKAVEESEFEPGDVLTMNTTTIQNRIPGIGPKLSSQLKRDINLQHTALRADYKREGQIAVG